MRCLSLAVGLKDQGANVRFVSRNLPNHFIEMLKIKGIQHSALATTITDASDDDLPHSSWLETSQYQDALATVSALSDQTWDWLVVDHYALDQRWERTLHGSSKKLMVIDDLADRCHDCDLLLDQNFYLDMQSRYVGRVSPNCKLILGPRYALLRADFKRLREGLRVRTGEVKKILIYFGGLDASNYTTSVIQAITELNLAVHVDVVIGAGHSSREQIRDLCVLHGYGFYENTPELADMMAKADLAIGAGGTSIWERCCLGLPALSFCLAENQTKQIKDAAQTGILLAPHVEKNVKETILRHLQPILENPSLLKLISNVGTGLVDGKGVLRVASKLTAGEIAIRRATEQDMLYVYRWRNHPTILVTSTNRNPILLETHQQWFKSVMQDLNRDLLIGVSKGHSVGVVRFDIGGDKAEVSIYVIPDGQSVGQGRNLLLAAEDWLRVNRPGVRSIRAQVLKDNLNSHNLFLNSSYQVNKICYQKNLSNGHQINENRQ